MKLKSTGLCFLLGIKNSFASAVAYRTNYYMSLFILVLSNLVIPFVTLIIYNNGLSFPGWSLYEILLIQGVFLVTKGIAESLFSGLVGNTLYLVKNGVYDMILLKPRSPIFTAIILSFDIEGLGKLLMGTIMCIISLLKIGYTPTIKQFLLFFVLIAIAQIVIFSFDLILAATSFVWIGNSRLFEIFDSVSDFSRYPISIYPKILKNIISYIIPVALMGYFPAVALVGKFENNLLLLILGAFFFLTLCSLLWRLLLPKYMSAGG